MKTTQQYIVLFILSVSWITRDNELVVYEFMRVVTKHDHLRSTSPHHQIFKRECMGYVQTKRGHERMGWGRGCVGVH